MAEEIYKVLAEIGLGNELSLCQRGELAQKAMDSNQDCFMELKKFIIIENDLDYFANIVVAEETGQGNEIIFSYKIGFKKFAPMCEKS